MATITRVAACHIAPVFLSAAGTTQKVVTSIAQAARNSAKLVVFPETFIPAFPVWSGLQAPADNHRNFARMVEHSIYVDGSEMRAVREAAAEAKCIVNIGFSEKARHSPATLYNSNCLINEQGDVLVHHRKLVPTYFEKLTWSPGDGHGLKVADTKYGKIGTLICGENTNPLARYTMMAQGEQIHISTWPSVWPTRIAPPSSSSSSSPAKNDDAAGIVSSSAKSKNYDNIAANRTRAAAHCFEAKTFGVMCASYMDEAMAQDLISTSSDPERTATVLKAASQAPTMFLDPTGALLPGFVIEDGTQKQVSKDWLQTEPGALYADLDLSECIEGKQYHDITGGYQRFDVFELRVNRTRREPIHIHDN